MKLTKIVLIAFVCAPALAMAQQDSKPKRDAQEPQQQQQRPEKQSTDRDSRPKDANNESGRTLTAQGFAQQVTLAGMKEIQLARLAQERAENSKVKQLASRLESDHKQANEELRRIAEGKGYSLPATNTVESWFGADSKAGTRGSGDVDRVAGTTKDAAAVTDAAPTPDRGTATSDVDKYGRSPKEAGEKDDWTARSKHMEDCKRLKMLSGKEFDREYVQMSIAAHKKSIEKFERASQYLDDAELKNFASTTLPKLREHLAEAQRLAPEVGAIESASVLGSERE